MRELVSTRMVLDRPDDTGQEVIVEGYVHYSVDVNYGCDADGNRGQRTILIDDVTEISAEDEDGDPIHLTSNETNRAARNLGDKFLNS